MVSAVDRAPTLKVVRRRIGDNVVRSMLAIVCDQCGSQDDRSTKPDMPEVAIARLFRARGWTVDERCRSAICPKCQETPKVSEFSAEAMKRQRQMFSLLDDHFDVDKGAFDAGWSDARVAKETGLAESAVTKARDAAYGPLKVPAEVLAAGRENGDLRAKMTKDVADVRAIVDQLERELSDRLAKLEAEIARIVGRAA